ncbi:uncharacterized protein K452DRAFT_27241 [Aplosporella prunicola CBS 121167]|uniref:Uncharacterized protein n=1 Tax=Aplosporella prunicola CBS 121167 TaxID=1176127 RepID=A0A6A6BFI5_9PEZI|nr:uncharacterized protein K452DRAFT_27241 [Aplosporella prunicola CBS 121167]KAF2142143.1 hypothetical protein K452DRAFT_27241 [Aplosporella prunicola CBS 121167]
MEGSSSVPSSAPPPCTLAYGHHKTACPASSRRSTEPAQGKATAPALRPTVSLAQPTAARLSCQLVVVVAVVWVVGVARARQK